MKVYLNKVVRPIGSSAIGCRIIFTYKSYARIKESLV